jgi:hypothetical protein
LVALADECQAVKFENGKVLRRIAKLRPLWKTEIARHGIVVGNDGQGWDAPSISSKISALLPFRIGPSN